MSLLKDLHQPGVLLGVDQVDIGVHIVVFKSFYSFSLLFVFVIQNLAFFLLKMGLCKIGSFLSFGCTFFVKLNKIFLVF